MKSKVYPTAIAAMIALPLLLVGLGWVWFQTGIWVVPNDADSISTPENSKRSFQEKSDSSSTSATAPAAPSATDSAQADAIAETVEPGNQDPVAAASRQAALRVSNQTAHPIRVALLSQLTQTTANDPTSYDKPAHWDFAPEEGSEKGLLLSLPEQDLSLQQGDILVAFAQDGSQRYWGPYVVGETAIPTWGSAAEEWVLILRP